MRPWVGCGLLLVAGAGGCDLAPAPDLQRMKVQPRPAPYRASRFFADGSVMRTPPAGALSHRREPDAPSPPPSTVALLRRGRDRFDVYCAACHGARGDGVSVVGERMDLRRPPSLLTLQRADAARLFLVITEGYGLMPSYREELSTDDRWAVARYVGALRRSQSVRVDQLPPSLRARAEQELR